MHASQHFNRVRLAVPATRDLVCESKVALIECQQQRMLQKQSSKKKERDCQQQMMKQKIELRVLIASGQVQKLAGEASALASLTNPGEYEQVLRNVMSQIDLFYLRC